MSDVLLTFFLNNKGKDFGKWGQSIKHQDLGSSLCIRVIETHKKLHNIFLLLKIHPSLHCSTSASRNRLKIFVFIPKNHETSEVGIDVYGILC